MSQVLEGQYRISDWQESVKFESEAEHKLTHADIKLVYSGALTGDAIVQYVMCYVSPSRATFKGFEVITIDSGSTSSPSTLTLAHNGEFKAGIASSQFTVVAGTGKFDGVSGFGSFTSGEAGTADYKIEIE